MVSTVNTCSVDDHKENKMVLNGRLRSFGAFVPIYDSVAQLNKEKLSLFLSLSGATLYYTFDENKLNSYGLDKRQLNSDKFHNVKHKTLVHITPRPQAQGQKPRDRSLPLV